MGRPKDLRRKLLKYMMNEREEAAFVAYFEDWKSNRDVTGEIKKNSVKNIDSSVGRYARYFLKNNWVNKSKKLLSYEFEYSRGHKKNGATNVKKKTKSQNVPCYKANISPFISYFLLTAWDYQVSQLKDEAVATLYLFYELKEVREYMLGLHPYFYTRTFGLYDCFIKTLENKLIFYWLFYEGRFFKDRKAMEIESRLIGKLPNVDKIHNKIAEYFSDESDDYSKIGMREEIVRMYDESWGAFVKTQAFKALLKARTESHSQELTENKMIVDLKIECYARLIYSEEVRESVIEAFLGRLTKELI